MEQPQSETLLIEGGTRCYLSLEHATLMAWDIIPFIWLAWICQDSPCGELTCLHIGKKIAHGPM
jgi:hypothetical protein